MKARIILNQADFSANNIGKYTELSDYTKKVLAKQTQYTEDSNEANSLNTFLNELISRGFLGGSEPILNYLVIPALAGNAEQLLFNIAELDIDGYPVDKRNDSEKLAVYKVHTPLYSGGKIVGLQVAPTSELTSTQFSQQQFQQINGLLEKSSAYPSMSLCLVCPSISVRDADQLVQFGAGYTLNLRNNYYGLYSLNTDVRYLKRTISDLQAGFIGIGYKNDYTLSSMFTGVEGELETLNPNLMKTSSSDEYNYLRLGIYAYDGTRQFKANAIALGKEMTVEQMGVFRTLINNLLADLNL